MIWSGLSGKPSAFMTASTALARWRDNSEVGRERSFGVGEACQQNGFVFVGVAFEQIYKALRVGQCLVVEYG